LAAEAVWITGASSGIGRALALELAGRGHPVAASARNLGALAELERGSAGRVRPVAADVTDREQVLSAVRQAEALIGPLAVAILNAGVARLDDRAFRSADFEALLDVNLLGVARCIEAVLPGMLARGRGRLVLVASLAGYGGLPRTAFYGASKAALINLASSLRLDLEAHGIIVQVVNPGFVRTPMTDRNDFPMPFLLEPEEAARRIARGLASSRFEIAFPRRLALLLKLANLLPYRLYFPLVRARTRRRGGLTVGRAPPGSH
jgi:NAD(P)-dependent dehydrogenase (short-subunit alcohol dehydrogenase family)